MYQIDIKFDKLMRPTTEASWVVLYEHTTIPRWRTAAILNFEILNYSAAD